MTRFARLFHRHRMEYTSPVFDAILREEVLGSIYEECVCGAVRFPKALYRRLRQWSRRNR